MSHYRNLLKIISYRLPPRFLRATLRYFFPSDGFTTTPSFIFGLSSPARTSIARITEINNLVTQTYPHGGAPRAVAEALILMLAPLAPHAAEELWARLGHENSLAWEAFPQADPALLIDDTIEVPVQVNGKVRSVINVPAGADAASMEALARADEKVIAALSGKPTQRVIAVAGRLINFVV